MKFDPTLVKQGETVTPVLGGKLCVLQKERGYRFSLDSILLSHFVRMGRTDRAIELGVGSAIISMILAYRFDARVSGIEVQEEFIDMSKRTLALNRFEDRVELVCCDVRDVDRFFDPGCFQVVVCNPPYRKKSTGKISIHPEKAIAKHEIKGELKDFIRASEYLLGRSGRLFMIYTSTRSVELICQMRAFGLEPKRLQLVHSHSKSGGEFVLVEGSKGGGEELHILPPLFVYSAKNSYSAEMLQIFRDFGGGPDQG